MEAGFNRFILDFSGGVYNGSFPLKKKLYKEIMKAASEGTLPSGESHMSGGDGRSGRISEAASGFSRFNWKDGFFSEKE